MIQVMMVLSASSALLSRWKFVVTLRHWTTTAVWLVLGFGVAGVSYFLPIVVMVKIYPHGEPLSGMVYGLGFAFATLLSVVAATAISPRKLSGVVMFGSGVLAMLFPMVLYFHFGLAGQWDGIFLLCYAGSVAGSYAVGYLLSCPGFSASSQSRREA